MANIQRIPEMIHGRRSKCQLVHGACNCWRTRRNGERRPLLEKTQTFWNRNNNQKWRIEFSKLTRTGPLGPALRTVAPNHWSDFWSICCPDALLFPVFVLFQISNWLNSPLIYAMIWFVLPVTSNGIDWHWSGISVLQRKTDPPRVTPGCSVCAVGAPTNNLQREMNQYLITLKRQKYTNWAFLFPQANFNQGRGKFKLSVGKWRKRPHFQVPDQEDSIVSRQQRQLHHLWQTIR